MHLRLCLAFFAVLNGAASIAQPDYFQQEVHHTIRVRLDDAAHELHGFIETEYVNNSPEVLDFLWIHVWPNAYEGPTSALARQKFRSGDRFMFWAMAKDLGGIDSLAFSVNGEAAAWTFHPQHRDIIRLELPSALAPGQRLAYSTPFRVRLPSGQISRLGHLGQSYQITQWYPKPAVFDRDGWHEMPYLDQGEFYSEYGSFDVMITLPKNYTVGATGDFVEGAFDNDAELVRLDSIVERTEAAIEDGTASLRSMDFPPSSSTFKTLHYRQSDVHDFAWFADKRWWVLRGKVEQPAVTTWAMFTAKEAELWKRAPEYLHDAIVSYSKWNGDYPYRQVTAVDGTISAGGGMEYPNVTVIGRSGTDLGLETVIVHEVGHNWFYGILGSNERTHAWMDEGINSFNETRYFVEKYGDSLNLAGRGVGPFGLFEAAEATDYPYAMRDQFAYLFSARNGVDQAMACHSDEFSDLNYGTIVYKKTAAAMEHLRQSMGTEAFDAGMHHYFQSWRFKHPGPHDLRASLEAASGQNLDWFFDELVPTTAKVDYRLVRLREKDAEQTQLLVANSGQINAPFRVDALDKEGSILHSSWFPGQPDRHWVSLPSSDEVERWSIDAASQMLEYDRRNNELRARGPIKFAEPLALRFFTRLDRADRTQVFWTPAIGFNHHDGVTAGLLLHNLALPPRALQWFVAPMRGLDSKEWVGLAGLTYRTGEWTWEAGLRRFGDYLGSSYMESRYTRQLLALTGRFNRAPTSPFKSMLRVEAVNLHSNRVYSDWFIDLLIPEEWKQALGGTYRVDVQNVRSSSTWIFGLRTIRQRALWGATPPIWDEAEHVTLASLSCETEVLTNAAGKKFTWRGYAGWLTGEAEVYSLQVAGIRPDFDPLYDGLFIARDPSSSWIARNTMLDAGGLPLPGASWQAEEVLLSTLFTYELPLKIPLSAYAGAAKLDHAGVVTGGFAIDLEAIQVFVPLLGPTGIGSEEGIGAGIVWSVKLLNLKPLDALRNFN